MCSLNIPGALLNKRNPFYQPDRPICERPRICGAGEASTPRTGCQSGWQLPLVDCDSDGVVVPASTTWRKQRGVACAGVTVRAIDGIVIRWVNNSSLSRLPSGCCRVFRRATPWVDRCNCAVLSTSRRFRELALQLADLLNCHRSGRMILLVLQSTTIVNSTKMRWPLLVIAGTDRRSS
jgi:hypothetical protein